MEDTKSELACPHVDEHCGHGRVVGHRVCLFTESEGHFLANSVGGVCPAVWPGGLRAEGVLGAAFACFHDRRRESIALLWRCRHWLSVWGTRGRKRGIQFCLEGSAHHRVFRRLDCSALSRGHHEVDHSHRGGGVATRVGHLSGRVNECHGQHFRGPNGGASRRQALHRHNDPIGVVCGHGGRSGLCGGFRARGLCIDWGSCGVPHCSVFHVGTRRVVVCQDADA